MQSPDQTPPRPTCKRLFKSATSPKRRSGRKRTNSDAYRKVALTRSATKILKNVTNSNGMSLSTPLRSKPFLLRILKEVKKETAGGVHEEVRFKLFQLQLFCSPKTLF